jgi:cytochrome c oxidase subunit IV
MAGADRNMLVGLYDIINNLSAFRWISAYLCYVYLFWNILLTLRIQKAEVKRCCFVRLHTLWIRIACIP